MTSSQNINNHYKRARNKGTRESQKKRKELTTRANTIAHGARKRKIFFSQVGKKPHDLTANLTEMVCKLRF